MRNFSIALAVIFLASLGITRAKPKQEKPKDSQAAADNYKISQEDIDKKNPVKPTPEGIAAARRTYGYDCAMCHGPKGDGKGELVDSMKLTLLDWRDATALVGKTDGELFYIITNGKGKMIGEGDRVSETMRWNLVNLVRSFSKKGTEEKPAS
ncbi:MAG TPA: cytochrome c [Candidatus Methylomirabilis sp.]|nr:cytochrome c [Candidatus Methylomirabilis sp.]